jgi:aspartate/methionine/tyrosine aminotransferase
MKILESDLLRIAARRVKKRLEINRRTLRSLLEATSGIRYRLPEQGAITFLKLIPWSDTRDFTTKLLLRHGVLIPDGAFFNKPGYVRLGFGAVPEIFQPAAERFFDLLRHAYSA